MPLFNKFISSVIYLCALMIFATCTAMAQEWNEDDDDYFEKKVEIRKLNETKWEQLRADIDYTDKTKRPKPKEKPQGEKESPETDSSNSSVPFNLSMPKAVVYVLALLILAFVIYKIFDLNLFRSNRKVTENNIIDIENLEEVIHESDLEKYLRDALAHREFKLAVRIHFLIILKELSVNNFINWKKDKTNREYLNELSGKETYLGFAESSRIFEQSWYGDSFINEAEYLALSPRFEKFVQSIRNRTL